mmetsp:Transcript_26063/g.35919  ORF Transcript_26063/g.35919 Transcript_26063/m.35919 type:complete len:219 (+) Transcript_26063:1496-2152(+)
MLAQHPAAGHVPPADLGVHVHVVGVGQVAAVLFGGGVGGEELVVVVVLALMCDHHRFVSVIEGDGGIQALLTAFTMVDGADLEAVLSTAHQARLSAAVTSALSGHDAGLTEHTGAAVIALGECDAILVVLAQVEVAAEPRLHAGIRSHDLDELAGRGSARVVEPAAAVHDVILLQHSQTTAHWRSMRKHEYFPSVFSGMCFRHLLEPGDLTIVNKHFV